MNAMPCDVLNIIDVIDDVDNVDDVDNMDEVDDMDMDKYVTMTIAISKIMIK